MQGYFLLCFWNSIIQFNLTKLMLHNYDQVWKEFEFWCEGVFFSGLGIFGIIANFASIITFLSPEVGIILIVICQSLHHYHNCNHHDHHRCNHHHHRCNHHHHHYHRYLNHHHDILDFKMRKQTFNQLLAGLAFCEIM